LAKAEAQDLVLAPQILRIRQPEILQILVFFAGFRTIHNFGLCHGTDSKILDYPKMFYLAAADILESILILGKL